MITNCHFKSEGVDVYMQFSVEEQNLIYMFDKGKRVLSIQIMQGIQPHIEGPEMQELLTSTIKKLESISDSEYQQLSIEFTD